MRTPPKPSLFLIGAPKAGTSALANFLARDARICVPRVKEPNFLCRDLDLPRPRDEEEYLSLFATTPETRVLLDASILSLYSKDAAEAIASFSPEARLVAILRDPVQAAYAWHGQMVFTGNEPLTDFEEALDAEADRKRGRRIPGYGTTKRCPQLLYYREVMRYGEQLERFLARFPRERLHVVRYETFQRAPEAVFDGVVRFAGLEAGSRPGFGTVNPSQARRWPGLHAWLKRNFAGAARAALPLSLRLALIRRLDRWTSREAARPPLPPHVASALTGAYRDDVERLESLLGEDFRSWRTA